jgi:aryl-alcohol dehydrogenase-like predicted oxidoreductase
VRYAFLGRSGLKVSQLALGTMNFGMTADEAESAKILDAALDNGINLIDTADVYGGPQSPDMLKGYGISEEILGRWLKAGSHREKVVLATKVYQPMNTGPNDRRLSAYHIRQACEDSLRRLQTDRIDLYQMHHIDRSTPWEEVWQAMEVLVQQGKVLYFGSSNFAGWDIATAQGVAKSRNFMGLISEQSLYNLTERTVELEVIPSCRHHGLGLLPWSPVAGGILGGVLEKSTTGRRTSEKALRNIERFRDRIVAYETFCREIGHRPALVALGWLLANPAVTAPIVGPRTVSQLLESLSALRVTLSPDTLARLDEIWPGPGGEAPVAYAW